MALHLLAHRQLPPLQIQTIFRGTDGVESYFHELQLPVI
jgi:hypothetical protein